MTLRPPKKAAQFFKERDPDSPISEHFIRSLIADGSIPCVRNGRKALVSVESIEKYLENELKE